MTDAAAPVDTFGLTLPPEWAQIPLGRGVDRFVDRTRAHLSDQGVSRTDQRRVEQLLRRLAAECHGEHVTLAALMAQPLGAAGDSIDRARAVAGDVGPEDVTGLLAATCTVSVMTQDTLATELPLTLATMAAAVARPAGAEGAARRGIDVADLEPPALVALPAGPAVRLMRQHTHHDVAGHRLKVFVHQSLVPYDDGRRAAVVSFATPHTDLARPLTDLFDAIAVTLRLYADET